LLIVIDSPDPDLLPRIKPPHQHLGMKTFFSELAVNVLDLRVPGGVPGPDDIQLQVVGQGARRGLDSFPSSANGHPGTTSVVPLEKFSRRRTGERVRKQKMPAVGKAVTRLPESQIEQYLTGMVSRRGNEHSEWGELQSSASHHHLRCND
jgi:hypothetical protein